MSRTSIKIHLSVLLKLHSQIILSQLTLTSNLSRVLVFTFIIFLSISAHPELKMQIAAGRRSESLGKFKQTVQLRLVYYFRFHTKGAIRCWGKNCFVTLHSCQVRLHHFHSDEIINHFICKS